MAAPTNAVDRLIEKVKNNLGRTGDEVVDDYAIVWINESMREVCNKANFWFMNGTTTIAFAQGDVSQALPSDFKDEDAFWIVETNPDGFTEITYMSIEDERRKYDNVTQGQPSHWRIDGSNNLILRPVPDAAYTIQADYWKYLADLVAEGASNDLIDNYPGLVEEGATYRGFRRLGELEDAMQWKRMFDVDLADLKVANAERILPDEFVLRVRPDGGGTGIGRIKNRS